MRVSNQEQMIQTQRSNQEKPSAQVEMSQIVNVEKRSHTEEAIIQAIEEANGKINTKEHEYEFSVHEKTKQIVVKVVERGTKQAVAEFPSEKILDMVAKMCELAGLFIDEKR